MAKKPTREEIVQGYRDDFKKKPGAGTSEIIEVVREEITKLMRALASAEQGHQANRALIERIHPAMGKITTVGGATTEEFEIPNVKATHLLSVHIHTVGASPVTIISAQCLDGKISVDFSADPGADHVLTYHVIGK